MKYIAFGLMLILGFMQYKLWFGDGNLIYLHGVKRDIVESKDKNLRLKARNEALDAEINDLKFGKNAIEERSRAELGMIKPGEIYYHIIEEKISMDD